MGAIYLFLLVMVVNGGAFVEKWRDVCGLNIA
ncbi:unnamed protein product, partial [Cuscuta campestris]